MKRALVILRRLRRNRSGHATLMVAGALTMLLAVSALGIDTGMFFLEKRRLQGIADAAALSAAADPASARAGADAALALNTGAPATLEAIDVGAYTPDGTLAPAARFTVDPAGSAVRLSVAGRSPSFFGRAIGFRNPTEITATATAARIDLAAFSIGSRLAAIQGGLPNALLSGLAGSDLKLTVLDYQSLVGGEVDLLRTVEALRTELKLDGATFDEVLAADVTLPQVLRAAAASAGPAAAVLSAVAGRVPATGTRLSNLIDLGPLGANLRVGDGPPIVVQASSFLRAVLETGGERTVTADADAGIPGIASTRVRVVTGDRAAHSPWLSVSAARTVTVRTSQARLYIDARLSAAAPLGLGAIRLPIFVELAPAEATLTSVSCAGGRARARVTLDVTPSVGTVAIADIDATAFGSLRQPLTLRPAVIVQTPLASVTAYAELQLGRRTRPVSFDAAEIAAHTAKTASTDDLVRSIVTSLLDRTALKANVLGLGLDASALTAALAPILRAASGPLDQLLNQATALAGVGLGQADVWVNGVRCGTPVLVG